MSETTGHRQPPTLGIFVALIVALGLSIGLSAVSTGPLVVTVIFVVAALKAYLVLTYFIHLKAEARFIKVLVLGLLVLLFVLYAGVSPDVVWVFGRMHR